MNYSRKIHCVRCGNVFPISETKTLANAKSVERLCNACYDDQIRLREK